MQVNLMHRAILRIKCNEDKQCQYQRRYYRYNNFKNLFLQGIDFTCSGSLLVIGFCPFPGNSRMCSINARIECIIGHLRACHSQIHIMNVHWFFRTSREKILWSLSLKPPLFFVELPHGTNTVFFPQA